MFLSYFFLFLFCSVKCFSKRSVHCRKVGDTEYKCNPKPHNNVMVPVSAIQHLVPRNVTRLDLSGVMLSLTYGSFSIYKSLTSLNLSSGQLSDLTMDAFKGLESLTNLDLSNNNLLTLPSDFSDVLGRLGHPLIVHLQKNKWDCSCSSGLMASLNKVKNITYGPVPAMCEEPERMNQTRIDKGCDRNECLEENDCDDMASCTDTIQGYTCACTVTGFKGSGKECADINECDNKNDCSKIGGKCINTHGSYKCECKEGFKGDGKICNDIDECTTLGRSCGEDGLCINTPGSFRCDCDDGYAANKSNICVDIDECKLSNHSCHTIKHSYCYNLKKYVPSDPGYTCLCESGYRKVGKVCVLEGDMTELVKILAMIIGGFFGILFLIIILTLLYRRLKNRDPEEEEKEESTVVMAGDMPPPVDFASLDMPQVDLPGQEEVEEEWAELEDEEEDTE